LLKSKIHPSATRPEEKIIFSQNLTLRSNDIQTAFEALNYAF
jgi:hypothetical protein